MKWDKANHAAEAVAIAAVSAWTVAHPEPAPSPDAAREKQELDERVTQLAALKFEYPGTHLVGHTVHQCPLEFGSKPFLPFVLTRLCRRVRVCMPLHALKHPFLSYDRPSL